MIRSSCGASRLRSLPLVLCLLLVGAAGIGIADEEASWRMAVDPVLLSAVPPALAKRSAADFPSETGGHGEVGLDQRNGAGNSPPDAAPDKRQLFMMLLMLRSTQGRYPFVVLR
jgi:hypothetical protein